MKILITENQLKNLITNTVREKKKVLREEKRKELLFEELSLILEKEIKLGLNLHKKLRSINKPFAYKILDYLMSDKIPDDVKIDGVDYTDDDDKTITSFSKDNMGNIKSRQNRIGKLLTQLKYDINDIKGYEMDELIAFLKRGDLSDFKLVDGDDILWAYNCENYDDEGSMGSCMQKKEAQNYLGIYTENPNQVKCLVLVNPLNSKVRGRALVWETDDGETYMDRVYLTDKQYENLFIQYAEKNGYVRTTNSTVTLDNVDFQYYPYLDTFSHLNKNEHILMKYNDEDENTITLDNTGGGYTEQGEEVEYGRYAGQRLHRDELIYLDYRIPSGYISGYAHEEDVQYIDDEYYLEEHCIELYDGTWALNFNNNNLIELTYGRYEGEHALMDDVEQLYEPHYGSESFALNDETEKLYEPHYGENQYGLDSDTSLLYEKKYGDNEYALEDDVVGLFYEEYGNNRYAIKEDCIEVQIQKNGYVNDFDVWFLEDDEDKVQKYKLNENINNRKSIKKSYY